MSIRETGRRSLPGASAREDSVKEALGLLLDRTEIVDVVTRVATLADARDWSALRSLFADEVELDHTSLDGGEPETLRSDDLVEVWRKTFSGFDATQHVLGNHLARVSGDEATCTAYVRASHYLVNYQGGDVWTLGGRYDYGLARTSRSWKIAKSKLTFLWAEGNQFLPHLAKRRCEEGLANPESRRGETSPMSRTRGIESNIRARG